MTVAVVAAGMPFLAPVIRLMPQATLAAVVVATVCRIDQSGSSAPFEPFRWRVPWALVALAGW